MRPMARMDVVRQQLTRHRTSAKAGRRQATDDVEIGQQRNVANERCTIERKRHRTGPGAPDRDGL